MTVFGLLEKKSSLLRIAMFIHFAFLFTLLFFLLPIAHADIITLPPDMAALKVKAEQGDASSQLALGLRYKESDKLTSDSDEAIKWFRKAADQGNAEAQFEVGNFYSTRGKLSYEERKAEARKWFYKAAEQGNLKAQETLGTQYMYGTVAQGADPVEAMKWLKKADEQGSKLAPYGIGWLYERGLGVTKDNDEAIKWFMKSADRGYVLAMTHLGGGQCRTGEGLEKDPVKVANWFRKAADYGDDTAYQALGYLYANGLGVEKSNAEAYFWHSQSSKWMCSNIPGSKFCREAEAKAVEFREILKPEDLEAVEKRIREWKPAHAPAAKIPPPDAYKKCDETIILSDIKYEDATNWHVWLNGLEFTPKHALTEEVALVRVTQDEVAFKWKPCSNSGIYFLTLKLHEIQRTWPSRRGMPHDDK
jgi:TPR repeat protein